MPVQPQQNPQPVRAPRERWRWPYWALAIGLITLEWVLPLRWWLHGPLTLVALAACPLWVSATWRMLRRAESEAASKTLSGWVWRVLFFLALLFVASHAAKAYLLHLVWRAELVENLVSGYRTFALIALAANGIALWLRPRPLQRLLLVIADHTARLVALSFGATILLGAFVLMLPVSVRNPADISAIDALFTAASAVCVTGLVVNQLALTYTFCGQVVVRSLIQIGGGGIMVL